MHPTTDSETLIWCGTLTSPTPIALSESISTPARSSCRQTTFKAPPSPGVVRGPGQNNWDISFGKNIAIHESLHAELRADMYNAFNHTQWNAVSTQLNGSTGPFGQVTGSREGRIIQLAAKVVF